MNTERNHLNLTDNEADKIAYVLMAALSRVTMLDSERTITTATANELFRQLEYTVRTDKNGNRTEG